jgi:hypothetical protein
VTLPPEGKEPPGTVTFTSPPGVLTVAPPDVTVCCVGPGTTLTMLKPARLFADALMRVAPVATAVTTPVPATVAIDALSVLHCMPLPLAACPDASSARAESAMVFPAMTTASVGSTTTLSTVLEPVGPSSSPPPHPATMTNRVASIPRAVRAHAWVSDEDTVDIQACPSIDGRVVAVGRLTSRACAVRSLPGPASTAWAGSHGTSPVWLAHHTPPLPSRLA